MPRPVNPLRTEARRREILAAAQSCFEQKGFHGASMAEICAAAGISAGGLYRYFSSKEEIIAAMAEEERHEVAVAFDQVSTADDFLGALSDLCEQFGRSYADKRHAALAAELLAEALRNPGFASLARETQERMRADIADLLRHGQAGGHVDAALDADEAATMLLAAADGVGLRLVFSPDGDPASAAAALKMLVIRYLQPAPAGLQPTTRPGGQTGRAHGASHDA